MGDVHRATERYEQKSTQSRKDGKLKGQNWAILAAGLTFFVLAILVALIQIMIDGMKAKIVADTEAMIEHGETIVEVETVPTDIWQKNRDTTIAPSDKAKDEENGARETEAGTEDDTRTETEEFYWDGPVINAVNGTVEGPSGTETYYNLPMGGVVEIMQSAGVYADYWVRDDGCKMYGDYIMIAADQSIPGRELGAILPTSRGLGMVCDTGDFIYDNPYQIDIAVAW